jgi:hypothetical protein
MFHVQPAYRHLAELLEAYAYLERFGGALFKDNPGVGIVEH